jgi:general secretion pathway protein A
MDLAYWGFRRWPFQRQRTVDQPGLGASHEEALARLLFLVDEHRRFGLLTGVAGTGKSCLLRRVKSYAERRGRVCLEVDATGVAAGELAGRIAEQFPVDCEPGATPARCWSLIQRELANQALVGRAVVAIVDHFDPAEPGGAAQLLRLMNLAESLGTELTLLVAARSPISNVDLRENFDLRDNVELSVELTGWSLAETGRFITETLRTAGAVSDIFAPDSVAAIHEITAGIPRDVVRVCDLSLLAAMSEGRLEIAAETVKAAAAELAPKAGLTPQAEFFPQPESERQAETVPQSGPARNRILVAR